MNICKIVNGKTTYPCTGIANLLMRESSGQSTASKDEDYLKEYL